MGQAAGLLLGAAGAVIGGVLTGGAGFAIEAGFLAGSILGTLLFPKKGPSPADIRVQDSAYGKWIPQVWGRYRVAGNVIWAGTPHYHDARGKGMGGKNQQPYVTMSLAIALCQGPCTAVQRIWANGKLVYDASNPSNWKSLSGSASMLTGWTFYPGDENQVADPTMQSQLGANNVPAYRGLCYVVFNELNLQQWGNYLPSFTFEVIKNGTPYVVVTGQQSIGSSAPLGAPLTAFCTYLQSNGTAYGWAQWNTGSAYAIQGFQMTAYGTVWQGSPINTGLAALPGNGFIDYDEPGVWTTGGNYYPNGSPLVYQTGLSVGIFGIATASALKIGGRVFLAGAGSGPLKAADATLNGAPPIQYQSASNYTMGRLLCATANYVYVSFNGDPTYGTGVAKFDHQCNFVGMAFTTGTVPQAAYAVSDSLIYFVYGASPVVWRWNGSAVSATSLTGLTALYVNTMYVAPGETYAIFSNSSGGPTFYVLAQGTQTSPPALAQIVNDVCASAGLQSSQYTAVTLTDQVIGYGSTNNSSPRAILEPLLSTFFADVSDSDGMLKFVRRGSQPVLTIPWDDLGADNTANSGAAQNPIVEVFAQEYELPAQETLSYTSSTTDYQTSIQRELMPGTVSNLIESLNVPIVLADNDAKVRVQAMLWERWSKRRTFQFATSLKYLELEPSDVISVQRQDGGTVPVRITKTTLNGKGVLSFDADFTVPQIYPNPAATATYTAQGGNSLGFRQQAVPYSGQTILQPMDLPPLRPQDASTPGLYLAATGMDNTWPGCYVDLSRDDVNFSQLLTMSAASVIGVATSTLGAWTGGNTVDESNSVTVQLYNPSQSLSSVSYASFLNGANAALIGTELVYFRTATQLSANTWQISGLLRYRLDTDHPAPVHTAGEPFVLLSAQDLYAATINLTDVGQSLYFDTYLNNLLSTVPSGLSTVQPANARLAPFAPHLLSATHGSYNGIGSTSDIDLLWFRKARVNNSWVDGADVPLDWSQESFRITVSNGSGTQINQYVLTSKGVTWSGSSGNPANAVPTNPVNQALPPYTAPAQPYFVYTNAWASADGFGSAGSGQTIQFTVQQIGDFGVAGHTATTSITR